MTWPEQSTSTSISEMWNDVVCLQGGSGLDPAQGLYGAQTNLAGSMGGLGAHTSVAPGMTTLSGVTGLNNMVGGAGASGVPGMGVSGSQAMQGAGQLGAGMGAMGKMSTGAATVTTSSTSISGMLADFSRALGKAFGPLPYT